MNATKIFLLPILFPWVSFGLNNMDTQPFALISIIVLMILTKAKISFTVVHLLLFIFCILIGTQFFFPTELLHLVRGIIGFGGFFIFFEFFRKRKDLILNSYRFLLLTNILWILGGLIEVNFPEFMAMFGSQRTTIDRGVTSFAPEPGFFGFVLFNYFVILVLLREYIPKRSFYVLQSLNVFSTIFLAQSAVAIVYFILMFGIIVYFWLLSLFSHKFNKYQLMLYPIFLVLIITAISIIVQEISDLRDFRAVTLATSLWDSVDFLDFVFLDASVNNRVEHVVLPWVGVFNFAGLPAGVGAFDYSRDFALDFFNGFFWYGEDGLKVMSWIGDWVITFGLIGVLLLIYIFHLSAPCQRKHRPYFWSYLIVLFSAIPVAIPLVPITLALFCQDSPMRQIDL